MGKLEPLVCTECGGHIDRDTMTCRYCGVQYKLDNSDRLIVVERFNTNVRVLKTRINVPIDDIVCFDPETMSKFVTKQIEHEISKAIMPFVEIRQQTDPLDHTIKFDAVTRLISPEYRFSTEG